MSLSDEDKVRIGLKLHPSTRQLLELFEYKHLPDELQANSKLFHNLAWIMAYSKTDRPQEQTECLRKLLEAKDCGVRMAVPTGQFNDDQLSLGD